MIAALSDMALSPTDYLSQLVGRIVRDADESCLVAVKEFLHSFQPTELDGEATVKLRTLLDWVSRLTTGRSGQDLLHTARSRYPANCLTPVHPFIIRRCCMDRDYDSGLSLLHQSSEAMHKSHHLIYQDHLLYHFYGALCYIAKKRYDDAITLLSLLLAVHGRATSKIQLDAYRKYLLLGLIQHGKVLSLPHTIGSDSSINLEILASEYLEIATAYYNTDFATVVNSHRPEIAKHGNSGLLKACVAALPCHKILRVRKIYLSLPLNDLSSKIGLSIDETTSLLHTMVSDNLLVASIDADGFVSFPDAVYSPDEQRARLHFMSEKSKQLGERMLMLERSLQLEPSYIHRQVDQGKMSSNDVKGKRKMKTQLNPLASPTAGVNV